MIDSHCHLDAPEFAADLPQVLARSRAAGVSGWLLPAVDAASISAVASLAREPGVWPAFGLHPLYIARHDAQALAYLAQMLASQRPCAVGEIGLDGFVPGLDMARQIEVFEAQLKLARDFELPVVVHVRRSQDLVLKYLRKWGVRRGIAHAFNGSEQQMAAFLQQGLLLGFGGALTYSGSLRIRRLACQISLSSLVLETDSPDMAPSWLAGPPAQRNEPAQLPQIAKVLAELRGVPLDVLVAASNDNLERELGVRT